jgi:hypothetical protein
MPTTYDLQMFEYSKQEFADKFMDMFEHFTIREIKEMMEVYDHVSQKIKKNVLRIIIHYRVDKEFWNENEDKEYLFIFKIVRDIIKCGMFKDYKEPEDFYHEILERLKVKLDKNEINENEYLIKCNNMNNDLKYDKQLLGMCTCNMISSFVKRDDDTILLHIVSLPCKWNKK